MHILLKVSACSLHILLQVSAVQSRFPTYFISLWACHWKEGGITHLDLLVLLLARLLIVLYSIYIVFILLILTLSDTRYQRLGQLTSSSFGGLWPLTGGFSGPFWITLSSPDQFLLLIPIVPFRCFIAKTLYLICMQRTHFFG